MEIQPTKDIEAFCSRCHCHLQSDNKNSFLGMHATKANETKIQTAMHDAGFAEFQGDAHTWPSLFLSADAWERSSYHSHVSLDLVKNEHFSYQTEKTAGHELFNTDCIQKDPKRELNDWMKLRAMDRNFDAIYLYQDEKDWMMDAPSEAATNDVPAAKAHGNVLTFGLGIGYFIYMALMNPHVDTVTCIESSSQVIEMFNRFLYPQFPQDKKVNIIEGDAFSYYRREYLAPYDYIFTDIWQSSIDGLNCIEKLLMQDNEPLEKADFWIEDSCFEIMWTLIFLYFDALLHHHKISINPSYAHLMHKIQNYFDAMDVVIYDPSKLQFYMYDTGTIRSILAQK